MAGWPVTLSPVFLSASVPDPMRNQKYFRAGDTIAIRDAVIALATLVLPRTRLVFGGHPAITPMVKWVADQHGLFGNVRMFQSKFFRASYLKDVERFRYEETEEVNGDRAASLLAMRTRMIQSEAFSAAFFIGGMEGVEEEYRLVGDLQPGVPRYPVYTTGGAARLLWENAGAESLGELRATLRVTTSYAALFDRLLDSVGGGGNR
jgi:hypothetical protein